MPPSLHDSKVERYKITIVQYMDGTWTVIASGPHTHQEAVGLLDMVKALFRREALQKALGNMAEGITIR